jgi:hypothetical protein
MATKVNRTLQKFRSDYKHTFGFDPAKKHTPRMVAGDAFIDVIARNLYFWDLRTPYISGPNVSAHDIHIAYHVSMNRMRMIDIAVQSIYTTQVWQRYQELLDAHNHTVNDKIRLFLKRQKRRRNKTRQQMKKRQLAPDGTVELLVVSSPTTCVHDDVDMECGICLEWIELGFMTKTSCNHMFHHACIQQWYKRQHSCPMCRRDISHMYNNDHACQYTAAS